MPRTTSVVRILAAALASGVTLHPTPAAPPAAPASTWPGQKEADWVAKDFTFQSGEKLDVRLHYVTLGEPRRDGAGRVVNAVLLLHGTSGTSRQWLSPTAGPELFDPGQPLDPARWFVIIPDGLGRGGSSRPSDGLRGKFPHYGYGDVVEAQHLLVTKGLGVDHLRAVVGTSMGGMHAWMWAERWPDAMDAVMPVACQPIAISGRNLLFRRIVTEAIRNDPDFRGGDYRTPPRHWTYTAALWPTVLDGAAHLQAEAPSRDATLALYDRLVANARTSWDANDFLRWLESSADYNPEPGLGKIRARLVAVNFADDALNPAELPDTETLVRGIPGARFVLVPAGPDTKGHLTLLLAASWKPYLVELLAALPPPVAEAGGPAAP
jgi:homoserine O-acetyltransferase